MFTEHYTSGALALLLSPEVKFVNSFWKTISILICTRQPSLSRNRLVTSHCQGIRSGEVYGQYLLHIVDWCRDSMWAWLSGDKILVGARFSLLVQTGPGVHPGPCTMGTGSLSGV